MNTGLAVLVKTPGLSPVKTRLASEIGRRAAERCFRQCVDITETLVRDTVKHAGHALTPYWAVGEAQGLSDPLWRNFRCLHAGDGGLGERLHHVYSHLLGRHRIAILIGADCPALSAAVLHQAIALVRDTGNTVLGPAVDGGFYLLAGASPIDKSVWCDVTYGSGVTRRQLVEHLGGIVDEQSLPTLRDIDSLDDLRALATECRTGSGAAMQALMSFAGEPFKKPGSEPAGRRPETRRS